MEGDNFQASFSFYFERKEERKKLMIKIENKMKRRKKRKRYFDFRSSLPSQKKEMAEKIEVD